MSTEREPKLRPRMHHAIAEIEELILQHYPDATFQVTRSPEDRRIVHLLTTVDVPDTTAVVEVVLARMMELQITEKLPLFVIPVRPRERVLAMLRAEEEARPR
jgi:hypothetical protein